MDATAVFPFLAGKNRNLLAASDTACPNSGCEALMIRRPRPYHRRQSPPGRPLSPSRPLSTSHRDIRSPMSWGYKISRANPNRGRDLRPTAQVALRISKTRNLCQTTRQSVPTCSHRSGLLRQRIRLRVAWRRLSPSGGPPVFLFGAPADSSPILVSDILVDRNGNTLPEETIFAVLFRSRNPKLYAGRLLTIIRVDSSPRNPIKRPVPIVNRLTASRKRHPTNVRLVAGLGLDIHDARLHGRK